jgi:hypothetical protein
MSAENRRKGLSKQAWKETFSRLFALAGPDWPVGSNLLTPAINAAEKAANESTTAYVDHGTKGAREALKAWEDLMVEAIQRAKAKRGCHDCGVEKVVEVVDKDGHRSCGRCRAGLGDAEPVGP